MEYTIPAPEIVAEAFAKGTPSIGQIEFAAKIRQEFSQFLSDGVSVTDAAEVGYTLDDFVKTFDAAELLSTFRNITRGRDTDDIDHASAVIRAAASQSWDLMVSDYEIALQEKI